MSIITVVSLHTADADYELTFGVGWAPDIALDVARDVLGLSPDDVLGSLVGWFES